MENINFLRVLGASISLKISDGAQIRNIFLDNDHNTYTRGNIKMEREKNDILVKD